MKMIGKYRVRGQLGRGGMGNVYKVEMPVIEKIAALKLLKPNPMLVRLMGMSAVRDLFITEAVTMAAMRHPHLVEIWDFEETDEALFYLMDYYCNNLGVMIGETYETENPSRVIPVERAIHYTRQILSGLACLHHSGIIHRDIKPFNVLITDYDQVKICDFGLSKLRGERFQGPDNLKVGTPWYAAPEQEADPDDVDFSADLYSVGVMLYRMLTGTLPMESPAPPRRLNSDLDESWDEYILKAIAPAPADRFANADEMRAALDDLRHRWEKNKENICRHPMLVSPPIHARKSETEIIRSQPVKVRPQSARERFGLDDLWRPDHYIQNEYKLNGNGTIEDRATGLVWQRGGSRYPVTWDDAHDYVDRLNTEKFAGKTDWRLPSVDELKTLLRPMPKGPELCVEPVFDVRQKWLWSCDRRSHVAAWYVSLDLGFVAWQDFTGYYYARAVRS